MTKSKRSGLIVASSCVVLLCVIAVSPGYSPVTHPFFANQKPGQVDIMAHGAGQGVAPTNTLKALQIADAQGADVLEVDVQLTKDNVLVLQHDDTLDRTTAMSGPVASRTWAELMAQDKGAPVTIEGVVFTAEDTKVVRLDKALAAFPSARWNIEIKNDSSVAGEQLCRALGQANLVDQTLVASFHDKAMAHFRKVCPSVATSMSPNEIRIFVIAAHLRLSRFVKTPAVAMQVPVAAGGFDLTNPRVVSALKARNIKLHYWTINEANQMRQLIQSGADGLLTDFVTRAEQVRDKNPD